MELAKIMERLGNSQQAEQTAIKTASAPAAPSAVSGDALREALTNAMATTEKTAAVAPSYATPQGDLLKMAEDLSNAEDAAITKQASIYGAAMCDGFMARYAEYEAAAEQVAPTKTASAHAYAPVTTDTVKLAAQDPEFQKFASENPELVKEAYELGYQQTYATRVKEAQDEFDKGYSDTMGQVHKLASDIYARGVMDINTVLKHAAA